MDLYIILKTIKKHFLKHMMIQFKWNLTLQDINIMEKLKMTINKDKENKYFQMEISKL